MIRLSGNYIKILKALHIGFIAVTFGGFLTIEALLSLKLSDENLTFLKSVDFIIYYLNNGLIYYGFLGSVATAIVYGLYTNWGFLKYYWIIIKWILLLLIAVIYISFYSPSLNALTSLSDAGLHLNTAIEEYSALIRNSFRLNIVLIIIYVSVFFISTIKPFGKRRADFLSETRNGRISILLMVIIPVVFGIIGSINLRNLRTMDINTPALETFENGNYPGKFVGGGSEYSVVVQIIDHEIKNIQINTSRKSKYIRFSLPVTQRIISNQKVNVDAITGATTTSKCIMKAVENALTNTN
jgi:uncharacterized protein with FMN-binding domain